VGLDRRTFPRFSVSCPVDFSVDLLGSGFLIERFSSNGTVLDISRNGLLAEVDRLVAVGTDCVLSLINAEGVVWPHKVRGKVRRSCMGAAGWKIAVQFDSLVDVLPQPARPTVIPEVRTF
jgi:hypothetical protein